jgi:hypothetical protein
MAVMVMNRDFRTAWWGRRSVVLKLTSFAAAIASWFADLQ